jgi:hypothetical protein
MGYLIGTDEAGYGPNLGPLVISASVWQAPEDAAGDDLFDRLRHVVADTPGKCVNGHPSRVVIADSKILYNSGKDLRHLERGLWAAWALLGDQPRTWREVWKILVSETTDELYSRPWFAHYDAPLPGDSVALNWSARHSRLGESFLAAGVQLVALRSRVVFPQEFNQLIEVHDSKGTMLSRLTLELVEALLQALPCTPVAVVCDKHGGRNRYGSLLAERFPEELIEVRGENRQESVYRFGPPQRRIEFRFRARAERCLSAALASMASKYLRELAMQAFNEFWCSHVRGLAPTAGYPQDARRFKTAIAVAQRQLGIDDNVIWRVK